MGLHAHGHGLGYTWQVPPILRQVLMRVFNRADLVSTEARQKKVIECVPASANNLQNVFIRPWHLAFDKKAKNGRSPSSIYSEVFSCIPEPE
jgi:hypothetical protein